MLERPQPCTILSFTLLNNLTGMFLLVSCSNIFPNLLWLVQGQGQNSDNKNIYQRKCVGLHNHHPLLLSSDELRSVQKFIPPLFDLLQERTGGLRLTSHTGTSFSMSCNRRLSLRHSRIFRFITNLRIGFAKLN